jgi:hypothetical protein
MVSLVLKLFVSSRPFKLEGVLCIYVLFFYEGQAENHLLYFFIWFKHTFDFYCFIIHDLLFVFFFHVITWLLSFYCQDYVSYAHVLSSLIPALNVLHRWSRLCWLHITSKIILFFTYLLEDEQELSLGMLIRCKRIYNFWCSMFVLHQLLYILSTLCGIFMIYLD